MADITLYDLAGADKRVRFSPYVWRVRMALAHKGLAFETVPWRFMDKQAIAFSGQGLVPVMVDGGTVVSDSWAIACHLDDTYPELPTLMGRALGRAHALTVKHWVERALHPLLTRIILPEIAAALHEGDRAYFRETRERRFGTTLERWAVPPEQGLPPLRDALAPARATLELQPYLGGERPSFADYALFGMFMWARSVSRVELLARDDPLHAWRERLLDMFDGMARAAPRAAT
jgi:glutathione S-transferase